MLKSLEAYILKVFNALEENAPVALSQLQHLVATPWARNDWKSG